MIDRIMDKRFKYAFIAGVAIGAIVAFVLIVRGGKDGRAEGPEAVIEAFYKAVAAGDWDAAGALSEGAAMDGYINEYRSIWEDVHAADTNAAEIASSILFEIKVSVDRTEKTDDGKAIYYILEAGEFSKERKAYMIKEEGAWRVKEITDAI